MAYNGVSVHACYIVEIHKRLFVLSKFKTSRLRLVSPRDTNGVDNISGTPRVSTIGPNPIINRAVTPRYHGTDLEHRILSEEGKSFGKNSQQILILSNFGPSVPRSQSCLRLCGVLTYIIAWHIPHQWPVIQIFDNIVSQKRQEQYCNLLEWLSYSRGSETLIRDIISCLPPNYYPHLLADNVSLM